MQRMHTMDTGMPCTRDRTQVPVGFASADPSRFADAGASHQEVAIALFATACRTRSVSSQAAIFAIRWHLEALIHVVDTVLAKGSGTDCRWAPQSDQLNFSPRGV
ncbi:hypothetical protein MAXJ12_24522 [Mesorhizobium alhagi CCNWXJ12-2]|uniref:Uncharacterized protein n=1 Tax=Mesorhizobium alhagi CCNWXJ12-2 TaxID=1107882 RepID=H0HXI3_9HYPH|nr:hypothetical protein MAXJ12_24522 [Mesorhizobium alhagi CCNWXJ12-2]